MAIRPILVIPDARLRAVADPIIEVDDEIKALAKDMLDTMYDAPGIGLAATQLGVMKRIVVMDLAPEGEEPDPMVLINPEITHFGEQMQVTEEGCLSIPELYYEVERPIEVEEARALLREAPGVQVIDKHEDDGFVTPIESAGEFDVFVSRIRKDHSVENGLSMWVVADNLRKGAALNAVQIAQLLDETGTIKPRSGYRSIAV